MQNPVFFLSAQELQPLDSASAAHITGTNRAAFSETIAQSSLRHRFYVILPHKRRFVKGKTKKYANIRIFAHTSELTASARRAVDIVRLKPYVNIALRVGRSGRNLMAVSP